MISAPAAIRAPHTLPLPAHPEVPLVLIPGFMCDARLFGPQIAALSQLVSVHVANIARGDSIAAMAEGILRNAPLRFALAGLSMGGMVAMEIVDRSPERVTQLALLDTDPLPEGRKVQEWRTGLMERVQAGGLEEVMAELTETYAGIGPRATEATELCREMARALGPDVFLRQAQALRDRLDLQPALARAGRNVLILTGDADRLCPMPRHERMTELIAGSRLEVIAGAGHLPTLEQPDATTAALSAWLATR